MPQGTKPKRPPRLHFKMQELPETLLAEVHKLYIAGRYYDDIVDYLKGYGRTISRSAVARYGAHFLARYERLKTSGEMARTIIADAGETHLEEAAVKLSLDLIVKKLLSTEKISDDFDIYKTLSALARVQSSGVQREKLKAQMRRAAQTTAEEVARDVRQAGLSDAAADVIRRKILGIIT